MSNNLGTTPSQKLVKYALLSSTLTLFACTTAINEGSVDYKSQGKTGPGLEVPPDLSQITKDSRASVPRGGAVNASALAAAAAIQSNPSSTLGPLGSAQSSGVALASNNMVGIGALGDITVQRDSNHRWLVVKRSPDQLWNDVKTFWSDNGFTLVLDQPKLGIMETEWNENRGKLPKDGVRRLLGKVLDSLYSTNERDKFRTRLEQTADGGTEIFITHKGMMEDFTTTQREQLKWKSRPVDPELETEFLKRLMIHLGSDKTTALTATGPVNNAIALRARIVQDAGQISLVVDDTLDQAWRRVGLSLDRTSFTVDDRDRTKGLYFVRYVPTVTEEKKSGFLSRLFSSQPKDQVSQNYRIQLTEQGKQTKIIVLTAEGGLVQNADATQILKLLAEDLK
jgi:outer membrane protein assembly factor BamC